KLPLSQVSSAAHARLELIDLGRGSGATLDAASVTGMLPSRSFSVVHQSSQETFGTVYVAISASRGVSLSTRLNMKPSRGSSRGDTSPIDFGNWARRASNCLRDRRIVDT